MTDVRVNENDLWAWYNNLLLSQDTDRVRKLVVRYELYKMSARVPGDIVECGVFKGVGFMYWLKLLSIFEPGSTKKVVGFDTFGEFAKSLEPYEKATAQSYVKEADFHGVDPASLLKRAESIGMGKRADLQAGDFSQTGPKYAAANPGFRISLLHLDFDTYQGTKQALECFYPFVSRGGVIVFDEYAIRGWGESDAADEFFADKKDCRIETVPHSAKPTAYLIKP